MKIVINHHRLGEITVSQTHRARRISISLRPPAIVRLTTPHNVTLAKALEFLDEKYEWVEAGIAKFRDKYPDTTIEMPYSTKEHYLRYNPSDTTKISAQFTDTEFIVSYPMTIHFSDPKVQEFTKLAIERVWSNEAKKNLPPRVKELAELFNFKYSKLSIRNTRSKWGSCTSKDDISLSIHLMRLPDYLVDYIILHELCHTIHKNHGEQFHALLNHVTSGDHSRYNKELKTYSTRNCY